MITSATIFRLPANFQMPDTEAFENALAASTFTPCGPTQTESSGWQPPRGKNGTKLAETVNGCVFLRLQTERRAVPPSAVNAAVEKRIDAYKQETGRERVGAKLKKEFKEDAFLGLLPRAFSKFTTMAMWIDPANKRLVIDSPAIAGTDRITTYLIEALAEASGGPVEAAIRPLQTNLSAPAAMAHWLTTREAPYRFTVDRDCELKTPDESKAAVRYTHHTLEIAEVAGHIASGKLPTHMGLTWSSRISFVLTNAGCIKKIKLLDVVLEGAAQSEGDDGFDADAAITTGEFAALIPDLIEALGGEPGTGEVESVETAELEAA